MYSHPIVTAEELACLLTAPAAEALQPVSTPDKSETLLANAGAALWLVKALLVYVALQVFSLDAVPQRYLWARGVLELLCAGVFWQTLRQHKHRPVTVGALAAGGTTLLMDLMLLLALPA
jgi:hypothetical protein